MLPINILNKAITGKAYPDPRGTSLKMFYTQMWKNGKLYNLEVLYSKATNIVYHFRYTRDAIGPLGKIK